MTEISETSNLTELPLARLIACHDCDLLMPKPDLAVGEQAHCPRCGFYLFSHRSQVVKRSLALVITALILYFPANFMPIMQINVLGQTADNTIWSGVVRLYEAGGLLSIVAIVVFLSSMLIPLLKLLVQLFVLLSIRFSVGRSYGLLLYRIYHQLREWGMLEVYMFGLLVSIVKLVDIAKPNMDVGMFCFIALLLVQVHLESVMEPHDIWQSLSGEDDHASH